MSLLIRTLSMSEQWFIYALAAQDILLPESCEEILTDLGEKKTDLALFAQSALEQYAACFSEEDANAAKEQFENLLTWAAQQAESGAQPDFSRFDDASGSGAISSTALAAALNELHRK